MDIYIYIYVGDLLTCFGNVWRMSGRCLRIVLGDVLGMFAGCFGCLGDVGGGGWGICGGVWKLFDGKSTLTVRSFGWPASTNQPA